MDAGGMKLLRMIWLWRDNVIPITHAEQCKAYQRPLSASVRTLGTLAHAEAAPVRAEGVAGLIRCRPLYRSAEMTPKSAAIPASSVCRGRVGKWFEHMFVGASGRVGEWFEHIFVGTSGRVGKWFEHMFVGASGRVGK